MAWKRQQPPSRGRRGARRRPAGRRAAGWPAPAPTTATIAPRCRASRPRPALCGAPAATARRWRAPASAPMPRAAEHRQRHGQRDDRRCMPWIARLAAVGVARRAAPPAARALVLRPRRRRRRGLQLRHRLGDGAFELRVDALGQLRRVLVDLDVGLDAVAFGEPVAAHVVHPERRHREAAAVDQLRRARRGRSGRPTCACRRAARAWPRGSRTGRRRRPIRSSR